jgi:hypothetical protein
MTGHITSTIFREKKTRPAEDMIPLVNAFKIKELNLARWEKP